MEIKTEWFRDRLADKRMSQRGLARAMGLDAAAVSLMLRGKREMKLAEAAEIARLLGVPAEEVLANAGVRTGSGHTQIQITGIVDGHGEVHCRLSEPLGIIAHPGGDLPPNINALQCRTAGTDMDHMDGWLLYVQDVKAGVNPDAIGHLSVCHLTNGVTYLAKPTRSYTRGRWDLSSPGMTAKAVELDFAKPVLLIAT